MTCDSEKLKFFCRRIMQEGGLTEKESALFAESLVNADMRGVSSHGVTRLKTYYLRLKQGLVNAGIQPEILADNPALLLVDGKNGMGVPVAAHTMELCIERAGQYGVCFAAVRGGNHFGYAAYFAEQAAKAGMIGVAMANGPVAIAPIGGREAKLGTNPLAVAIPAGDAPPLVLDMATSVVARGKITLAKKQGKPIPLGWGIDANGTPTTDPASVHCVLPFGGAKGYGIALIIEMLCSCLSGAKNGQTMGSFYDFSGTTQDAGFFLGAINIGGIMAPEIFAQQAQALFASIKESPRADGCDEIFIPGEIEQRKYHLSQTGGIEIPAAVLDELLELSAGCGIPFDAAVMPNA